VRCPVFIDCSNLDLESRGHPFDNEPDKSQSPKDSTFSHGSSELSTGSRDTRLKERIVYGGVQFPHHPWYNLEAGAWLSSVQAFQPDTYTCSARQLILELLIHDHSKRATVYDALSSSWIQREIKELKSLYRRRIVSEVQYCTP